MNMQDSIIHYEGDDVVSMYFVKEGICGKVLPRHTNKKFININKGCYFGITDIIASMLSIDKEDEINNWMMYKNQLQTITTVKAEENTELLTLSIIDLNRM